MQNPTRLRDQGEQASFLSKLSPAARRVLEKQIDPAELAALERHQELAAAAAELRAEQRARAPLPPVERRVARQRPRAPKPPRAFFEELPRLTPAWACRELRRMRNRKAVAAIRVAAFSGGRGWDSRVALGVIRHALALLMLADQRGVVRDVPMTLLMRAHQRGSTSWKPHRDTIGGGVHRPDGGLENGQAGYTRLLELAGFLAARQYRKRDPRHPEIAPSCNFYTLCEPEIPITECETQEECEATLEVLELASIPHPSSGVHPRPP